jgi:acetyl-CoA synthetase
VVFGGFSAASPAARLRDMKCKVLVTQDGGWRRGGVVRLKASADQALADAPSVESVAVLRRSGTDVAMQEGRDHWWHELVAAQPGDAASCPCEEMDAEDLLYLLYSSGTTAQPKAVVHTTGGYLVGVASTHHYVFDIKPDTVYWCAADIGWVTGHSYIVYGPLCNGTTGFSTRARPTIRTRTGGGRSWSATGSPCCTRHPPRSAAT